MPAQINTGKACRKLPSTATKAERKLFHTLKMEVKRKRDAKLYAQIEELRKTRRTYVQPNLSVRHASRIAYEKGQIPFEGIYNV